MSNPAVSEPQRKAKAMEPDTHTQVKHDLIDTTGHAGMYDWTAPRPTPKSIGAGVAALVYAGVMIAAIVTMLALLAEGR